MQQSKQTDYLLTALTLAQQRRGFCSPNPAVGAVIVRDDRVIGEGCHYAAGEPHAELLALANINAKGATLYVTLEPCCNWGKTPPCTNSIITAGIKEVIFGYIDPNPRVSGRGIKQLEAAGIPCQHIELSEINYFYRSYAHWTHHKLPWVTAKLALSLDGKIASHDKQPIQLTGEPAQQYTHQARYHTDAILTTATTLNQDNPQFNVRLSDYPVAKPVYVIDSQLTLRDDLQIYHTAAALTVFHCPTVVEERLAGLAQQGVNCIAVTPTPQGLRLQHVLAYLGDLGCHDVWVEAGGTLFSELLQTKQINTALCYVAPKVLGMTAYPAFLESIALTEHAQQTTWRQLGDDALLTIDYKR